MPPATDTRAALVPCKLLDDQAGLAAVLLVALPVTIVEVALGSDLGTAGRFLIQPLGSGDLHMAAAILAGLFALAFALVMAWPVVRDFPLRPRRA